MRPERCDVLHIVPALFDMDRGVLGGAERYALELAKAMASRLSVRLLTFGPRRDRRKLGDLEVVVETGRAIRGNSFNRWSPAVFRWFRTARVIHCHQRFVLASSSAALFGRLTRTPVFVSDLGGGGWDVSAYLDTTRWFSGHLHISQYSRRISGHEHKPWAHVVYGGVDHARFRPPAGDPDRDGSVLFVGRILPHKGINYLVEAARGLAPLRVVGVPYGETYQRDLTALAEGASVEFTAGVNDDGLIAHYQRASVAVLPSVYRDMYGNETRVPELLGQTLLEAMACETPVICTDVASMPEVVVDGVTGFVVPPNDPAALRDRIGWLLAHPQRAREMGIAARRRVLEKFSWDAVVSRCLDAYGLA